jgi:hypothetical protein
MTKAKPEIAAVLSAIIASLGWLVVVPAYAQSSGGEHWINLTAGGSFDAWQKERRGWKIVGDVSLDPNKPKKLLGHSGASVLLCEGDSDNLVSKEEFKDVALRCEFMIAKGSNSGVKLNGMYEIQIRDTAGDTKLSGDDCGGVYPRAVLKPGYTYLDRGIAPMVNAAKPAGQWQSLELEFVSPRFDKNGAKVANARFENVRLNGKVIHQKVDLKYPTGVMWNSKKEVPRGPLLLQGDHGPVAFRNMRIAVR